MRDSTLAEDCNTYKFDHNTITESETQIFIGKNYSEFEKTIQYLIAKKENKKLDLSTNVPLTIILIIFITLLVSVCIVLSKLPIEQLPDMHSN